MIYKVIHKDFEIDLLDKNVDFTEQNQWFVQGVPINFTLPISMTLSQELDESFGMISHLNSDIKKSSFDVKVYKMDKVYDAELTIETIQDIDIEFSFKYGFDEYPNFSKALRLLPLEEKQVSNLRNDANERMTEVWPQTNYKYPSVITPNDIMENDSGRFDYFENSLNLYESGAFVENVFNTETSEAINRTVMHPFPYLLHVLSVGFQDAGFTLVGDIVDDAKLKKTLFGKISDYYISFAADQEEWVLSTNDMTDIVSDQNSHNPSSVGVHPEISSRFNNVGTYKFWELGWLYEEKEITEAGIYKIAGNVNMRRNPKNHTYIALKVNNDFIYVEEFAGLTYHFKTFEFLQKSDFIDHEFEAEVGDKITVFTQQAYFHEDEVIPPVNENRIELNIIDLTITQVSKKQGNTFVPNINEANKVKLNEVMPNKKFGDLVKAVMDWRNLDINIDLPNKQVVMNRVDKSIDLPTTQDLSIYEVRSPQRKRNQNISFLLSFQPKQDDPNYKKLLFSRKGSQVEEIRKDENTQEIPIDLYPVLHGTKNNLTTTKFEDKAEADIAVFFHDGSNANSNTTEQPNELMIPSVFEEDYMNWLYFRLNSTPFKWSNIVPIDAALELSVYKKSFAYNQVHFLKKIIVKKIDKDFCEVDFETEA